MFATDGILTREYLDTKEGFDFVTKTDIEGVIANIIEPILNNRKVKNYYSISSFQILVGDLNLTWKSVTKDTNLNTGYSYKLPLVLHNSLDLLQLVF